MTSLDYFHEMTLIGQQSAAILTVDSESLRLRLPSVLLSRFVVLLRVQACGHMASSGPSKTRAVVVFFLGRHSSRSSRRGRRPLVGPRSCGARGPARGDEAVRRAAVRDARHESPHAGRRLNKRKWPPFPLKLQRHLRNNYLGGRNTAADKRRGVGLQGRGSPEERPPRISRAAHARPSAVSHRPVADAPERRRIAPGGHQKVPPDGRPPPMAACARAPSTTLGTHRHRGPRCRTRIDHHGRGALSRL